MVLYYLRTHGGESTVTELAEQIAAMENDTDVESLTRQQQKRVYVSLYQTHIPKLADAGIIDYDQDSGRVELTDQARDIDRYLPPETERTYPWQLHYLGLAVASGLVLFLSLLGVPGFTALPASILGVLVVTAFGVSAIAQYVSLRRRRTSLPSELDGERW